MNYALREEEYLELQREVRILSRYEMQLVNLFMINCNYLQKNKIVLKGKFTSMFE